MADDGILRSLFKTDIDYVLVPTLVQSVNVVRAQNTENIDTISKLIDKVALRKVQSHRQALLREVRR